MSYAKEIEDLHQFFQDYFSGKLPAEAIERFINTLDTEFALVNASGNTADRHTIIDAIRQAHAQRPDIKIWIEQPHLRHESGDLLVATYEEWQTLAGKTTQRQSTVIFERDETLPNGLRWLHVHESGLKIIEGD